MITIATYVSMKTNNGKIRAIIYKYAYDMAKWG